MTQKQKPQKQASSDEKVDPQEELKQGYVCSCGYVTDNARKFGGHVTTNNRLHPGEHISLGLQDLKTKEVLMPPVADRTPEQVTLATKLSRKKGKGGDKTASAPLFTSDVNAAEFIRFVPRVIQMDFSPILRAGYAVARDVWGWKMPFQDWLETWIYKSYEAFGIELAPYRIVESPEEESERLAAVAAGNGNGHHDDEELTEEEE